MYKIYIEEIIINRKMRLSSDDKLSFNKGDRKGINKASSMKSSVI